MGRGKAKGSTSSPARARDGKVGKGQLLVDQMMKPRRSGRLGGSDVVGKEKLQDSPLLFEPGSDKTIKLQQPKPTSKPVGKRRKSRDEVQPVELEPVAEKRKKLKDEEVPSSASVKPAPLAKKQKEELSLSQERQLDMLKEFDLNYAYGPCRGISRRERFLRAQRFGLQPVPDEVILRLLDSNKEDVFQNCIWDQNVLLRKV